VAGPDESGLRGYRCRTEQSLRTVSLRNHPLHRDPNLLLLSLLLWLTTSRGNKKKEAFFSAFPGAIPTQSAPVAKAVKALKEKYSKVGGVGYCWGYKVIVTSEGIAEFDAVAGAHPS
jgi:hypothetical protein